MPHDLINAKPVAAAVREFFDAHPQEHAELRGIRQPLTDFRARCGYTGIEQSGE